jgi:hypothetical protein
MPAALILRWLIMPFQCGEDLFEVQVCLKPATAAPSPRHYEHLMSGEALLNEAGKNISPDYRTKSTHELGGFEQHWNGFGSRPAVRRNPAGETNEC